MTTHSLYDKRRWTTRREAQKIPDTHPWESSYRVFDLSGAEDWLTLGDLFTGAAIFGAAGSGKTSALASLAYSLMLMDCGFVWLCAKPDEVHLARRIAHAAGRSADVIVIGEDVDGQISPHRFNALDYEASIPTTGTGSVVKYLSACYEVLSQQEGEQKSGGDDAFWVQQFERLLRYCIDTAKLAGRTLSVELLRRIQASAPTSARQLEDDDWAESSVCWQCLNEAYARLEDDKIAAEDFTLLTDFWTKDYASLDPKPRGTINVMFAALVDAFYAEEPLRTILTTTTTVTPEEVIEGGKIVILSLPTNVYHSPGAMCQFAFKFAYQRAMLRRRKPSDGSLQRPSVLWVDEAHAFAHPFDHQYFAEVRSNRGISILLEQGVGGYMRALGYSRIEQVDGFLQNLGTKIFFGNSSPETNNYAADVIGKLVIGNQSRGTSSGGGGFHFTEGMTETERHQVISGTFQHLRNGGPKNDLIVQGVVTTLGKTFSTTGTNYSFCYFPQTELTR